MSKHIIDSEIPGGVTCCRDRQGCLPGRGLTWSDRSPLDDMTSGQIKGSGIAGEISHSTSAGNLGLNLPRQGYDAACKLDKCWQAFQLRGSPEKGTYSEDPAQLASTLPMTCISLQSTASQLLGLLA